LTASFFLSLLHAPRRKEAASSVSNVFFIQKSFFWRGEGTLSPLCVQDY
jgi:hypothetical protein